jgi:hypothetical protein
MLHFLDGLPQGEIISQKGHVFFKRKQGNHILFHAFILWPRRPFAIVKGFRGKRKTAEAVLY